MKNWKRDKEDMKLWKYKDYEEYKKLQIDANIKKLHAVWCSESTVKKIRTMYPDVDSVLCHGARNGRELEFFLDQYPDSRVNGTDISPTANEIANMFEWDFHEVKEEWVGKWNMIYSNSFDHSYDPEKCLRTWTDQLTEDGILCVELMVGSDNTSSGMDPLQISKGEFLNIVEGLGFEEVITFNVKANHGNSRVVVSTRK